ncbi:MobF family relaxase [Agromyces italicus]|uniref:MobF family relaxase n=1 Tax=Agromyces italicus TaxID=279572 RepID=UPI0004787A19|nr:MobF family relaxase [Agromyces italicus]
MRVMSAGNGYKYFLRSIAAADGDRSLSTPLTRYYAAKGTPPGRWIGSGVRGLGCGRIAEGDEVTEPQLQLLIGMGRDPVSGAPLGRGYPSYREADEPTAEAAGGRGRAEQVHSNEAADDAAKTSRRRAVAGYDFTFSIPKSASVLWGISDVRTQAIIARAHHTAVAAVLAFMEREVAATRSGATAVDGAVAQVDVAGLIATAFDHFDSRAGDPHLHTHVVISNKVQTVLDGKWRSLDGRPMHAAVVALSELHETLFADQLTRELGVGWEQRARGNDRKPAWAIAGVPELLVAEFSTRARHIDVETDRLIAEFIAAHGRRPSAVTIMKLRAQATLATRPAKEVHSLAELTASWRNRAQHVLGENATTWSRKAVARGRATPLQAEDVSLETIAALAASVVRAVGERRATWRHWNLVAEAARQTMEYRFAAASDREAIVGLVVDAAERASLRLTPPELASSPVAFLRADGASVFRPRHTVVYTSTDLIDAEARLLERAGDGSGPQLRTAKLRRVAVDTHPRHPLTEDYIAALTAIVTSGRVVDVLVGPAGAGKTTAMSALRRAWEAEYGAGSVLGLAPSAAAAHVLAEDLGIATENLAKWWQDHTVHGTAFRRGQLVIIDEASLAGTLQLDRVTALAASAGAKVLLVGDYAQLQSVDAGGAFALLVRERRDAPELVDVHRFTEEWEKRASLELRDGNPDAIDRYLAHDRVRDGSSDEMADAAYRAWRADARASRSTVLISDSNEAVAALNMRARMDGILDGRVDAIHEVGLHDATSAAVGDTIITRRNDRRLLSARSWVRNGDRWTVIAVHHSGKLEVRRHGQSRGTAVVLPREYVKQHVELGYAVTSHRAQGLTTDTAHVVVASGMTRENLYVAMTRGRESNRAYVAVDRPDVAHAEPHPGESEEMTARGILFGVLRHVGAELSAHEEIVAQQEAWGSIGQLAAEYETIAAAAQHDRWAGVIRASGLTHERAEAVIASDAFGPLTAELRRAQAQHIDVETLLPRLVAMRRFDDAQDVAAVLRARVMSATSRHAGTGRSRRAPRLIAGLLPMALGELEDDMRLALAERAELIEARAAAILERELSAGETWTRALAPPSRGLGPVAWKRRAATVAAYRDRYCVVGSAPLGPVPQTQVQKADYARARVALEQARRIGAAEPDQSGWIQPNVPSRTPDVSVRV